jgi:DNA polymerase-3 subunit gamma/tau
MLTREAFNALLKTLEEPPEHVKFIFCTTEAAKIPITILSRCQRFDFAGISTRAIFERLGQIVRAEGVQAEPEALEILARRAAGSMRDSQSLLEQLLSFASGRITVADVHGMLGTAGDQRLAAMVRQMAERNAAAALAELDGAVAEGVDVGQLLEQLLGYFRDCMAAAAGCSADAFLYASGGAASEVVEAGRRLGLQTVLAAMQILDATLARLRFSTQGRILAELAIVRLCELEELDEIATWIGQLQAGAPAAMPVSRLPVATPPHPANAPGSAPGAVKKNVEPPVSPAEVVPPPATPGGPVVPLSQDRAAEIWSLALERLSGMVVEQAKRFHRVEVMPPGRLVVSFKPAYALAKSTCQRPEQVKRFEQAVAEVTGQRVAVEFIVLEEAAAAVAPAKRVVPPYQRLVEAAKNPLVRRAGELFGAQPLRVEDKDEG